MKGETFQGQEEGISAHEVLAGNRRESGFVVQAGSCAPKTVCPQNGAESLLNVSEERVSGEPNQNKSELANQRSWDRESLATKDKFKDGRCLGPNYLSPC